MSELDYDELMRRALARIGERDREIARLRAELARTDHGRDAIAIVSLACRFPGADDPEQLWDLLEAGRSVVREVPATRWDLEQSYDPDPERVGRSYSRWGCFLDDVTGFDAELFGISRREADWMDPQQRVLLELVWTAFERAGQAPLAKRPRDVGVFVGASSFDYLRLSTAARDRIDAHTGSGAAPSALAGRIAFAFGLRGPTTTIDSACSSSLVAVHLAVRALRQRECDAALAAGTSLMLAPEMSLIEARTRMLAPDGRCKSFDAAADGVVRGEGVGVVLLRRLADALADRDPIVAVIRGSAVNHNGHAGSLTTPHAGAQRALLELACADAGVEGSAIEVVEAHGTGTAIGDPIEAEALIAALSPGRRADQPVWIGSLKPNLGHLEATAGIAGLIKLALEIERGRLLPVANLERPNPAIDWQGGKLAIATRAQPWPDREAGERLAGVSAFGFAGTNAHVILARAPAKAATPASSGPWLLPISAATPTALVEFATRWRERLIASSERELGDLCWTATVGRAELRERAAIVGDRRELIAALEGFEDPTCPRLHRARACEPAIAGWLIAELGDQARDDQPREDQLRRALDDRGQRLLAALAAADAELIDVAPARERERAGFAGRVAGLVELRDRLEAHEHVGVGSGAPLAAWLAGGLRFDDALALAWWRVRHDRAEPHQRPAIARAWYARLETLAWSEPKLGLLGARGERVRELADWRRCVELDRRGELEHARAGLIAAGSTSIWTLAPGPSDDPLAIDLDRPLDPRARLELEARAWVRGHARRQTGAGERVLAPTYPFEHRPAWIPHLRPGEQPEHAASRPARALLGAAIELVGGAATRRFEASFASDAPSWLADHRVFDRVVFPGAAWIEIALQAGRAVFRREAVELEELELPRPLVLSPGRRVVVQTLVEPDDDAWRVEIHSRPQTDDDSTPVEWSLHARARVRPLDLPAPASEPRPSSLRSEPAAIDELHARARAQGVEFGPEFRVLVALGTVPGTDDPCGAIELPSRLASEPGVLIHPVLLDACLRVIGRDPALALGEGAWLPARVARVRCWRPAPASGWCRASSVAIDERRRSASARYFAASGEACVEIEGVELRRKTQLDERATRAAELDWIHRVEWTRLGSARAPAEPIGADRLARAGEASPLPAELLTRVATYAAGLDELEAIAGECVAAGLRALGLEQGELVDVSGLCRRWKVGDEFEGALARLLDILAERGELERVGASWRVRSIEHADALAERLDALALRHPALTHEVDMLRRCGLQLPDILRGHVDPLESLMGGDARAVERLYRAPLIELENRRIAAIVRARIEALEPGTSLRILEIGAGTGETSARVFAALDALGHAPAQYCWTDVSPTFLERARERFEARPWLRFERLDLDDPPPLGAAGLGRFDLVIASNVLHVTRDLRRSLTHVRWLLAPGGHLVIMEGAVKLRWVDLGFGLTPGWWRFSDRALRPDYPLLQPGEWESLLLDEGFAEVARLSPARPELAIFGHQRVLVARVDDHPRHADPRERWLVVGGGSLGERLVARVRELGELATHLRPRAGETDLFDRDAIAARWRELEPDERPTRLIHLIGVDERLDAASEASDLRDACERSTRSALALVQATLDVCGQRPPSSWMITRGAIGVADALDRHALAGIAAAPVWGLGRVLDSEHPELATRRLDLEPDSSIAEILAIVRSSPSEDELALRAGGVWVPRLRPAELLAGEAPHFDPQGCYVITGGTRGVGLETARWLVARGARKLALLARREPEPDARASMAALEREGATLRVIAVDVADGPAIERALASVRAELGPLRGVFHSAGLIADATVLQLDWDRFARVLAPKLEGAWNLHRATLDDPLDHFVLYSSAVAVLRAWGQANHCAANTFLAALAAHRRARDLPALVVDWGAWEGVGAADRPEAGARMRAFGMGTMPADRAFRTLAATLAAGLSQAAILPIDWRRFTGRLRATPLLRELGRERASSEVEPLPALVGELERALASERPERLREALRARVAKLIGLREPSSIDPSRPLFELGLDSLMAIELKNGLAHDLGLRLRATLLFDFTTVEALADHLLAQLEGRLVDAPPASPTTRDRVADRALADEIRNLDEIALGALIDAEFEAFATGAHS
ncbi:type I polyketide synthase [Nannocystaceae bacterium ST9]